MQNADLNVSLREVTNALLTFAKASGYTHTNNGRGVTVDVYANPDLDVTMTVVWNEHVHPASLAVVYRREGNAVTILHVTPEPGHERAAVRAAIKVARAYATDG